MNTNQLMTAGAVAFAGFALWYITRGKTTGGSAAPVSTQPGQQQRDAGLKEWFDHFDRQYEELQKGVDYSLATLAPSIGIRF